MPPSDPRQEGTRRALIVATEQEDAGLLAFQLKKLGLTTMVVTNESDALGALAWGTPDIIVVELGGPDVDALCVAADSGRFEDVLRLAHTIKGASGNIGADAMMEMSRRVELAAKTQDKDLLVSETQRTRELYRKTTQVIRERLGS